MDGEEVVELYLSYPDFAGRSPLKALKGFKRIFLKAGESRLVSFVISPEQLSIVSEAGEGYQPSGRAMISIGGGQPGVKNQTTSNVVSKAILIK